MNAASLVERPTPKRDVALAEGIARDTHTAVDVVQRIYEQELETLARGARITQFLSVLASRRVRLRLRKQ